MSEPVVPPPPPAGTGGTVSQNRTIMIVLSYLWLLALVPLLVEKDDKEVQWHAKHGLVLAVAEIAFWIIFSVFLHLMGPASCFGAMLMPIVWLVFVVVHVICIVQGTSGKRFLIPGLSQFADRF